jgi:hypothetical protein
MVIAPERYRSGRNGPDSKSGCRLVAGTWVRIPPSPPLFYCISRRYLLYFTINCLNKEVEMRDDLRQELTGWGKIVWGDKSYNKIYYKVVIEKERPDDDEPDIYGTVNDKQGDKLDIPDFVGTTEDIILHMSDDRYLKIVFLDESEEFEVDGGFNDNK